MASLWDDYWSRLVQDLIDKAITGGVVALVGFWLQRRLEVFKRNHALISETAKARIAAYHRVLTVESRLAVNIMMVYFGLHNLRIGNLRVDAGAFRKTLNEAAELVRKDSYALVEAVGAERFLVGASFGNVILKIVDLSTVAAQDAQHAIDDQTIDVSARIKTYQKALAHMREALKKSLPPFMRSPRDDMYFGEPDSDALLAELDQHITKMK